MSREPVRPKRSKTELAGRAIDHLRAGISKLDVLLAILVAIVIASISGWHVPPEREQSVRLTFAFLGFFLLSHRVQSEALRRATSEVEARLLSSWWEGKYVDFAPRTFTCLLTIPLAFVLVAIVLHAFPALFAGVSGIQPARMLGAPYVIVPVLLALECLFLCVRDHWGRKGLDYPIAQHPLTTGAVWLARYGLGSWLALEAGRAAAREKEWYPSYPGHLDAVHLAVMVTVAAAFFVVVQANRPFVVRMLARRRAPDDGEREGDGGSRYYLSAAVPTPAAQFTGLVAYMVAMILVSAAVVFYWDDGPIRKLADAAIRGDTTPIQPWLRGDQPWWTPDFVGRAMLAWHLSVVPIVTTLPILAMALWNRRTANVRTARPHVVERAHIDVTRGWLLCQAIFQRSLPFFLISLPVTTLLSYQTTDERRLGVLVGGTVAWLGPLLRDLYFLDETLQWAYQVGLRRTIEQLNGHVLILGFGDLARRLVRTLLDVKVFPYCSLPEDLEKTRNILLPTGRLAKVLTSMAAVEVEERNVVGAIRPIGHPPIGWVDLNSVVHELREEEAYKVPHAQSRAPHPADVDYILAVVVGDGTNAEVQAAARLERAAFVVCLINEVRGAERSQSVLNRLEELAGSGRRIPAAIAIHSSTYVPYVTEKRLRYALPIHYIFPEHLEGLNAAVLVYAAYLSQRELLGREPRILLCGSGKRLLYLVDSFLKSFSARELSTYADRTLEERPLLTLLSTDERFTRMAASKIGDRTEGPEQIFKNWKAKELSADFEVRVLKFLRYVTRHPVPSDDIPNPVGGGMSIPLIRGDAADYGSAYAVLRNLRPDIVLVSEQQAEEEFTAINAIGTNVVRFLSGREGGESILERPPLLLVSGDTGKHHLVKYFDRALRYYSSLFESPSSAPHVPADRIPRPPVLYPSPFMPPPRPFWSFSDPLIDVLDDPAERLVGIIRAYVDVRTSVPVELNFCDPDTPGMMAVKLATLAGYKPVPSRLVPHLSFANTRMIALPDKKFMVKGYAYLDPNANACGDEQRSSQKSFCRLGVVAGYEPAPVTRRHARRSSPETPASVIPLIQGLLRYKSAVGPADFVKQLDTCCGMPTCPIEAFNKVAAGIVGVPKSQARVPDDAYQRLRERFTIGTHALDTAREPDTRPFAHFRVRCQKEDVPGSFATALNALLFTRLEPMAGNRDGSVEHFNLTYISSYECHDERRGVFTCYGRRTQSDRDRRADDVAGLSAATVIETIELFPIRGALDRDSRTLDLDNDDNPWRRYANELTAFLNEQPHAANDRFKVQRTRGLNFAESIRIQRESAPKPAPAAQTRDAVTV